MNVAMLLSASAARRPGRAAWICGTAQASYAETAARVARLAGGLRRSGLGPGDRLVLVMPNGPALFEMLWACFWAGLVAERFLRYVDALAPVLERGVERVLVRSCQPGHGRR